jgi:hypothetical protein
MSRRLLYLTAVIASLFILLSSALSQTVVSRTRIGHQSEGSAYVSTGPLTGNIVVLDGLDLYAFPLVKTRKGPVATKIFDLKQLSILGHPNGVAYIPQERLFAFTEGLSPDKIFLSDGAGRPQGVVTIKYLNGWMPSHVEGIAYIPPDAPMYPDHFVTAPVNINSNDPRLEVVSRDGTVDLEIFPSPLPWMQEWGGSFLGGVDYQPGGTLLCGVDNNLVEYDFFGHWINYVQFDTGWFEGITRLPNATFAAVGYQPGTMTMLNSQLQRTPALDRNFLFAPGLTDWQNAIAWNSDSSRYELRLMYAPVTGYLDPGFWLMPTNLSSIGRLFGIPADIPSPGQYRQMVYMPDDHLLAVVYRQNNKEFKENDSNGNPVYWPFHPDIHLYDNFGTRVQEIHLNFLTYNARANIPSQIAYIPGLRQFVYRQSNPDGTATPNILFVSRDSGQVVRTLDLTSAGITGGFGAMVYFRENGTDKLLFNLNQTRAIVTGLGGVKLLEYNPREKLGILNSGAVSIGSTPGTFATMDAGEFIVFQLGSTTKRK